MEQHEDRVRQYSKIRERQDWHWNHISSKGQQVYPRYNVLGAILIGLERIDPSELSDLDKTREQILVIGDSANTIFTENPSEQLVADTMADERESFCNFICGVSDSYLYSVKPLPYRRVLSESESEAVRSQLYKQWQISGYDWFPPVECSIPNIKAFQSNHFNKFCLSFSLKSLLSSRGISHVYELRHLGPDYEKDLYHFYMGEEGYYSSADMDWIAYKSYELSTTVGGWLLDEIREQWPEWRQYIWY